MSKRPGLTLVEIIIVLGIVSILFTVTSFSIARSRNTISLDSTVSSLINDIKSQQLQAMSGFTQAGVQNPYYGIYFENKSYTLFHTNGWQAENKANFSIDLDKDSQFNTVNLFKDQIVFASASGTIENFDPNKNYVTIKNIYSGEQKTVYFNKFAVVYAIN